MIEDISRICITAPVTSVTIDRGTALPKRHDRDASLHLASRGSFQTNEPRNNKKTATFHCTALDMGVSKNRGTPKWMVYKGKPY